MSVGVGQVAKASDIMDLSFFPVGMVLPIYSSTVSEGVSGSDRGVWINGTTAATGQFLKDWFICNSTTTKTLSSGSTATVPNLTDRFICGTDSARGNAGANSVTLTESNLPPHSHSLTTPVSGSGGGHRHSVPVNKWDNFDFSGVFAGGNESGDCASGKPAAGTSSCEGAGGSWSWRYSTSDTTFANIPSHTHAISGSVYTSTSGGTLTLEPAYYSLVFIRKCG